LSIGLLFLITALRKPESRHAPLSTPGGADHDDNPNYAKRQVDKDEDEKSSRLATTTTMLGTLSGNEQLNVSITATTSGLVYCAGLSSRRTRSKEVADNARV